MNEAQTIIYLYPGEADAHGIHHQKAQLRASATRQLGYTSYALNLYSDTFLQDLTKLTKPGDIVFAGRNGYDAQIQIGRTARHLFDALSLKVVATLADHPFTEFMIPLLTKASPNTTFFATSCLAEELKTFYPQLKNIKSLPWQLLTAPNDDEREDQIFTAYSERDIDILIPLGLHKFANLGNVNQKIKKFPVKYQKIAKGIFEEKKKYWQEPILTAFKRNYKVIHGTEFIAANLSLEEVILWMKLLSLMDWTFRYYKRIIIIRKIFQKTKDQRIVITATRDIVQKFFPEQSNSKIEYIGQIANENLKKLYRRSKIVVNSNPGYDSLVSERIRNAMLSGCSVLSDKNSILEDTFGHKEEIFYFEDNGLENIVDINIKDIERVGHNSRTRIKEQIGSYTAQDLVGIFCKTLPR